MIRLKNINIKNVLGIEEYHFDFSSTGLYLILGENGKGKSSIFESILWAIYGKVYRGNLSGSDIVNENSDEGCLVRLQFEKDESEYIVQRTINHPQLKNSLNIFENEIDITRNTVTETQKILTNIFGDFDSFTSLILFPQQQKRSFLEMTDSEQKILFDKLLSLNLFETFKQKAKLLYDKHNDTINELEENFKLKERDKEQYKEQAKELSLQYLTKIQKATDNINRTKELISSLNIEDVKKSVDDKEKQKQDILLKKSQLELELIKISNDKLTFKNKLDNKKDRILEKINNIKEKKSLKFQTYVSQIKSKYQDLASQEIQKSMESYEHITKDLQIKIDSKTSEYNNLIRDIDKIQNNLNDLQRSFKKDKENLNNIAKQNIDQINKQISELQSNLKIDGNCPICMKPIDEESRNNIKNVISKYNASIEDVKSKLANDILTITNDIKFKTNSIEQELNELTKSRDKIYSDLQDLKSQKDKVSYDDEVNQINRKYENLFNTEILTEKEKIKVISDKLVHRYDLVNKIYNVLIEKISEYEESENLIHEKIATYNGHTEDIESELQNLKNKISEYEKFVHQKDLEITYKEDLEKEYDTFTKNMTDKITNYDNELNNLKDEIDKKRTETSYYSFWLDAFKKDGIKNYIIGKSIPFLNKNLSQYVSQLSDKFELRLSNQSELKSGEIRDKLSAIVRRLDTNSVTKFQKLSGGEKRILDIAMMFSLYKLATISKDVVSNVLFLDEVFESLDEMNVELVIKLLKDLSKNSGVYIITHNAFWKDQDVDDIIEVN